MAIIKIKNAAGEWEDLVSDSLEDNSPSKALSAKQGKILDESKADKSDTYTKTEVNSLSNGKIDKPTSSTPAGKFMQTDDHGNAIWGDGASGAEVGRVVTAWLEENISGGQTIAIDTSLSVPGAAAESATVGNLLDEIIQVADEEPTDEFNKIWVEETPDSEIEIPDYEDFENLVTVSSDEPTAPANKVWIKPSRLGEVAVTTYEEFTGVVAPDYDTINVSGSMPIKVGQHCIHNGEYYSCKIEITEPETFTLSHWTKMTVGSEASDLKSAIMQDVFPVTGENDTLEFTGSGGKTTNIYLEAGTTYTIENITPENVTEANGGMFIEGYSSEYTVNFPRPRGTTVEFIPLHSGYLRMYYGDSAPAVAGIRVCGEIDTALNRTSFQKGAEEELHLFTACIQSDENRRPIDKLSGKSFDNNGNIINSSTGCITDYIPVKAGNLISVFCSNWGGYVNGCVFYNENKEKIGVFNTYAPRYYGNVVPDGAYYVRVNIIESHYNDVIIRVNPITIAAYDAPSLRKVLDYTKNNSDEKKYKIYIKNGTYNIASTFTDDEINNAEYSADGWCGLDVGNNVHLYGESCDGVILSCTIATTYSATNRDAISTLNIKGNCVLENITVKSENIRYPIHDDFAVSQNTVHCLKNCKFIAGKNATGQKTNGYGLGTRSGETIIFDNCYIEPYMIYHNNTGFEQPSSVIMNNCEIAEQISLWDFNCEKSCTLYLNNVKCPKLIHTYNGTHDQTIQIDGVGASPDFIVCDSSVKYNLGQCVKKQIHYGGAAGIAVKDYYASNDPKFYTAASTIKKTDMLGILLEDTGGDKVGTIQTSGYISANKLGTTDTSGWAVGDLLKISSSTAKLEETTDASLAVAIVVLIIDSIPYIKLLI